MSRFKILWIDDQKNKCRREIKSIEKIIGSLGFESDVQVEDDISTVSLKSQDGTLNKAIRARDIDLFVIDYNLKNELFGTDVVEEIRQNNDIYTDIIFYSSMVDSLIGAVKNSYDSDSIMDYCDGVYIAPLGDEFIDKVKYVITKIIKSWYNVHSIRGIVLSKASKFEQLVSQIIKKYYIACLGEIKDALKEKGSNVCSTVKGKWKAVNRTDDPVPQILDDPINFNWTVKKTMFKELVNESVIKVEFWDDLEYVFDLRNKFAHNPMHFKDGVLVLSTKDNTEIFSETDIDEIRDVISRVEEKLIKLSDSDAFGDIDFDFSEDSKKELCVV